MRLLPLVLVVGTSLVALGCADQATPAPRAIDLHETASSSTDSRPSAAVGGPSVPLTVTVSPGSVGPPDSTGPIDRKETALALGAVDISSCKTPGGPTGTGHLSISFAPNGRVVSARVDQPPFAGTPAGTCIAGQFSAMRIPPFGGEPVHVGKSFEIK